jgi:phenylalanyl-tRNA synthetase alpha chain
VIPFGKRHPLTQTHDDIVRIFSQLGYGVMEGPEVETDYYNFDALNIGPTIRLATSAIPFSLAPA